MNTLKNGSKGADVTTLQLALNKTGGYGLTADGIFGAKTEAAVKDFQKKNKLGVDGIAGPQTWTALGYTTTVSTVKTESSFTTNSGLVIHNNFLDSREYVHDRRYTNDYIILHHTAGHDNPDGVVKDWNTDRRGRVCTEFVVGGQNCLTGASTYDGRVVKAFPDAGAGYHIGASGIGSTKYDVHAVGIENCCMGHVKDGKVYTGAKIAPSQVTTLQKPFRGFTQFHRYSDKQLESLRKLLLYIGERDNIDLHTGLYQWIKKEGAGAFDYHADAYNGKVKGIVTHANIRPDKEDMFPQPELIDMILSL